MKDKVLKIVDLSIDIVHEPEWNPNEQSPDVFNELVKNIKDIGCLEPILVAPRSDIEGHYWAISGSHRWKASKVAGLLTVPCIIEERFDEDMLKVQNIKFNIIKGKLDPLKFTQLFDQLAAKYGEEVTRQMMAFVDKAVFDQVYQKAKAALPDELKKQLDKAKKEIKTIDNLAAILGEMFQKYGNTLEKGYMVFNYGGQSHLWIQMDDKVKDIVDRIKRQAIEGDRNINELFYEYFGKGAA